MRTRNALILVIGLAGCTAPATEEKSSMRQRQDAALKDPFSYGPAMPSPTGKPLPPEAGPKRDDTAKGDWDRFWNP